MQVDVDSFGVLLRYYGYPDTASVESFYDRTMPRLLELFSRHGIPATFFVIGADVRSAAGAWLPELVAAGHEVASHTEHHPLGLTRLTPEQRQAELIGAEEAIAQRIGERPVGFRSPGYDVDEALLELLEARGYLYDSSVFPSPLAPAVRLYQALIRTRRHTRHGTMGRLTLLAAPRFPYRPNRQQLWRTDPRRPLCELPVATASVLRLPFYGTAHLVGGWSAFEFGFRWFGRGDLVYAMHAWDVLGPDRDPLDERLIVHPGLRLTTEYKLALFDRIFERLSSRYTFVTSRMMASSHRHEFSAARTSQIQLFSGEGAG